MNNSFKLALVFVTTLTLLSCSLNPPTEKPVDSSAALNDFVEKYGDDLPLAPPARPFPASNKALTKILVGSCNDEEKYSSSLSSIAKENADLFLMVGDNVYGDVDGRKYLDGSDPELTELRASFADLAQREEFQAVRERLPMMVAWDDHDYGINDGGSDFAFREAAELIHERFWGLDQESASGHSGTYYSRNFGPEGKRTQIIVLDTRFFRSPLTKTDKRGAPGKERYVPSKEPASEQSMLGESQWKWLTAELKKPADLRLIVSSIQVLPEVHGWESWNKLPTERQRLFDVLDDTNVENVIFVSGDRHASFIYESKEAFFFPVQELTASSLNLSFFDMTPEMDSAQIGEGYSKENYGSIAIDWEKRRFELNIHANDGKKVRSQLFNF